MKKMLCIVLAFCFCLGLCGCQTRKSAPTAGESWEMGYGQCELSYDEPVSQYYVAGYHNDWKAIGLLDRQTARAVFLSNGVSSVLLLSIDCIALGRGDTEIIQNRLHDLQKETNCGIFISATHTHAGADTLGLWGPVAQNGKNKDFMENLYDCAESASRQAYADRVLGRLYFGRTEQGIENLQEDSREPQIFDPFLSQLRFEPENNTPGIRLIHYSAHAESLRGNNRFLSADYPAYLTEAVEDATGDRTVFFQGAIGGLIMTRVLPNVVGVDCVPLENVKKTGKLLAQAALSIQKERELLPILQYQTEEVSIPVDNGVFVAMKALGILSSDISFTGKGKYGVSVNTQVSRIQLDGLSLVGIPGEIFPELIYGGTETGIGCMTDFAEEDFLILGLCNDEIGYIIPPAQFLLHPDRPFLEEIRDATGENHYEETNSVGKQAAGLVLQAIKELYR